ncbi:IPT/TIG domain-containing protein, partial [Myxococcota bacterium]|nr:IPT/TIG domain-containing protein [Myxococcota bacterium]
MTPTGTFDRTLASQLSIVLEATSAAGTRTVAVFDDRSTPSIKLHDAYELYAVNLQASAYFANSAESYRFRVRLSGEEIGFSDVSSLIFPILTKNPGLMMGVKVRVERRDAPVLASISPDRGPRDSGDFTLTVSGSRFVDESVVRFGGRAVATTKVSPNVLTARIPADHVSTIGTYEVSVVTPAPGGGTSAVASFQVYDPAPVLTSLSPDARTEGSGALALTVYGSAFSATSVVRLAGSARATQYVSSNQLIATLPAT